MPVTVPMAATWFKPLHINKGKSIARTIYERTGYAKNPSKTEQGELVVGFACDPRTVDEEFLLAKKEYDYITGRDQGSRNVLAYQIRQSFRPGEITPQEALEVGYELASRFTKNRHSFIVAVHTDRKHLHCHIIFNSTTVDCTRKFKNFWRSSYAVRRLSDLICAEHGLSIIENPKPSKGRNYGDWLGDAKPVSWSEKIRRQIDDIVPSCASFEDFISALRAAGYSVKDNRKHITVLAPGQKRPTRLDTLGGDHTEAAIRERIANAKTVKIGGAGGGRLFDDTSREGHAGTRVSLLIDIQAKIQEGKGAGYEQWIKIFNLQAGAKTLVFLKEQGIDSYEDLKKKASSASGDFNAHTKKIKDAEARLSQITELQKYIGQYGKTRDVYARYKASGWNRDFYDEHAGDIILHRAAKKYFDGLGMKKLPSINSLKQEWAALAAEKKKLYAGYHKLKESSRSLTLAKANADKILGLTPEAQTREISRGKERYDSQEK